MGGRRGGGQKTEAVLVLCDGDYSFRLFSVLFTISPDIEEEEEREKPVCTSSRHATYDVRRHTSFSPILPISRRSRESL